MNSIYTIPSHRKYIATLSGEINFLTNSGSVIIDVNLQEAVAISFDTERQRLNSPECYYKSISAELRPKRDKMAKFLQDLGMVPTVPEAGYSIVADFSNLSRFTTAIKFTVDWDTVLWVFTRSRVEKNVALIGTKISLNRSKLSKINY